MYQRRGLGLLSWLLASLIGCTGPAASVDRVDEQPSSDAPAGPETPPLVRPAIPRDEVADDAVLLQFIGGPPGLLVSCENCPGLPAGNISVDKFPPITAPRRDDAPRLVMHDMRKSPMLRGWLLATLIGCTGKGPAAAVDVDEQPSSDAPSGPETPSPPLVRPAIPPDGIADDAILVQFVGGPPDFVVSCENCPGGQAAENVLVDNFPPITAPIGTTIKVKLRALGFMSNEFTVTLDSKHVEVPVELSPLERK
jgi:hypothetical protein